MRWHLLISVFFLFAEKATAQLPPALFTVTLGGREINIETITNVDKGAKHKTTMLYFFSDPLNGKGIHDVFIKYADSLPSAVVMLKINIGKKEDSTSADLLHSMANDVVGKLLPQLKKYKRLSTDRLILAGVNEGAVLAFYCAASSAKIKRTGMFFSNYDPFIQLRKENDSASFKLSGKVYIYNKKKRPDDISADEFCEAVAMQPDLLLFKSDVVEEGDAENAVAEFFGWIIAEGSNYVFKIQ